MSTGCFPLLSYTLVASKLVGNISGPASDFFRICAVALYFSAAYFGPDELHRHTEEEPKGGAETAGRAAGGGAVSRDELVHVHVARAFSAEAGDAVGGTGHTLDLMVGRHRHDRDPWAIVILAKTRDLLQS